MIHYHGTPISPKAELEKLKGKHFCVSYARSDNIQWCIKNAQSIMLDNGAFTAYTQGKTFNSYKYQKWLDDKLLGANWAVIPDVIGGSIQDQKDCISQWAYPKHLSAPVWHMNLSFDWLREILNEYPRFCFGSSGQFWKVGSDDWKKQADLAWNIIEQSNCRPWVHMMRGLSMCKGKYPFASADSTNVARNFKSYNPWKCPKEMCERIDSIQTPLIMT